MSYTTEGSGDTKAIQNLLGLEDNVCFRYYLYNKDIQGSTTSVLNEDGAGELSYVYDDFGETGINGSSAFQNEICYTGGIYDETTGLYYLNARYYDPENGRFLTEDTYRGELNEPDTLHLYVYCKNNPINYMDPSGHKFLGFWNSKQKYFAYNQNAPQKYFGYYDIYDYAANYFGMRIGSIKFETKKSKIGFWKGQYGEMHGHSISSGCEIGLYYSSGRFWNCAYQKNRRIRMSMSLYKRGYKSKMFTRDSASSTDQKKAWWLTAFQPYMYMPGKKSARAEDLKMTGMLWFDSSKKYKKDMENLSRQMTKKRNYKNRWGRFEVIKKNSWKVLEFTWHYK